ncbi:MAG: hypothetical protein ACYTXA_01160 [Nostoc sp.]
MVTTLDDTKRNAIAVKLASIKALQELVIENEKLLLKEGLDAEIADRIRNFINDNEKNLGVLETVIGQYRIQAEAKKTVRQFIEKAGELFKDSELSLYEKVFQHELLKHQLVISAISNNLTTEQSEQLTTEFKAAKTRIQQKLGVVTEVKV